MLSVRQTRVESESAGMSAGVISMGRLLVIVIAATFAVRSFAQAPLMLQSAHEHIEVEQALTLLRDEQGQLTLADVMASDGFQPLQGDEQSMNFGYLQDVLWLKLPLQSADNHTAHWMLAFEFAYLDDIRVFVVQDDGVTEMHAGLAYPVAEWQVAARKPVFPFLLDAGEKATLYIRAASQSPLVLNMGLATPQAFNLSENVTLAFLALYFGMLVALGCYNLLLFITLRQREFLLYTLFVFSFGMAASHMNGVAQLTLGQGGVHSPYMVPTGFALAATLAVLFARRFLWLRNTLPGWHRALGIISVLWSVGTVSTLLVAPRQALEIMSVMAVLTTVSLLSAGILAMRHKVPAAGIFVFAWTLLLVGTAMLSIRNTGLLPSNNFTVFGMQFGSATEMLLLSFALAARFTDMKEQKEKAQQALVQALILQEQELEKRVVQRTEQLEQAKARLQQMVHEDILTGLPNRLGLSASFDELKRHQHPHQAVAVLLIDLDGFKPVNDEHGHGAGDELLRAIASGLQEAVAGTGVVGRLGGDEFVALLSGFTDYQQVKTQADALMAAVNAAGIERDGVQVAVAASIGICFGCLYESSLKTLIARADEAMYEVKRNGKRGISVYQDDTELAFPGPA